MTQPNAEKPIQNGSTPSSPPEDLPKWLNKDFFTDIAKKQFGKCEIVNLDARMAFEKGENYTSDMHRIVIDVKLPDGSMKKGHYLTKSMIQSALTGQLVGDMALFPKEIEMYEKIVPQMEDLYKRAGIEISFGGQCVKIQKEPPVLVLEDLSALKFENIKRQDGMDQNHVEATLEKLAMWHAATARIFQLRGHYSDLFRRSMLPPGSEKYLKAMWESMWGIFRAAVTSWGCERYLGKMERLGLKSLDNLKQTEQVNPLEFNVLNHGDMWCNNIMFRHKPDGTVEDVKLVDLQICRWGTPVQDLSYFLITSCSNDIRVEKFEYFIKCYHDHLVHNLELLKYSGEIPSLLDLQILMLKKGFFCYNTAVGVLTIVLAEPSKDADIETFFDANEAGDNFKRRLYENPRYAAAMQKILPFLDNRGILDM